MLDWVQKHLQTDNIFYFPQFNHRVYVCMCMCVCVCVRARLRAVLKRKKSVYGLKTSVHHFIQQLAEKILSFPVSGTCPKTGRSESYGFKRVPIDHCFFRHEDGEGNIMFLLHYVDDLVIATTSLKFRGVFLAHVNKNGRRLQRASSIGIWVSTISGMRLRAHGIIGPPFMDRKSLATMSNAAGVWCMHILLATVGANPSSIPCLP